MNGLTATGITVGICAGLWQMLSSQVGPVSYTHLTLPTICSV